MRRRAEFRRVVERLLEECRKQGIDLSPAVAEDILADRVKSMAAVLRVREEAVVRSHLPDLDVAELAAAFKVAEERQQQEVAAASPAILDLASVGRVISSLAQAVRCVSLNHQALGAGEREKWEAIGVLDDASNGLTLFGAAVEDAHAERGVVSVLLGDEAIVYARRALSRTTDNLRAGRWSFGHEAAMDAGVADRMAHDLALLPPEA